MHSHTHTHTQFAQPHRACHKGECHYHHHQKQPKQSSREEAAPPFSHIAAPGHTNNDAFFSLWLNTRQQPILRAARARARLGGSGAPHSYCDAHTTTATKTTTPPTTTTTNTYPLPATSSTACFVVSMAHTHTSRKQHFQPPSKPSKANQHTPIKPTATERSTHVRLLRSGRFLRTLDSFFLNTKGGMTRAHVTAT